MVMSVDANVMYKNKSKAHVTIFDSSFVLS